MKTLDRVWLWLAALALGFTGVVAPRDAAAQECLAADGFRKPYLYVGKSADDDDHHGDFDEAQGITNGHSELAEPYWYYSRNTYDDDDTRTYIYRVPYTEFLGWDFDHVWNLVRMPDGDGGECEHIGGIDYHPYWFNGTYRTYIAAAYEGCDNGNARIAFFSTQDLGGNSNTEPRAVLDVSEEQEWQAPWVSVRSDGRIYTTRGGNRDSAGANDAKEPHLLHEYTIDWDDIRRHGGLIEYYDHREITLRDFAGDPIDLAERQGGDFSPDGEWFVISANLEENTGRLFVFEVTDADDWYLVRMSSLSEYPFKFNEEMTNGQDEREGLSYYDLNCVADLHPETPRSDLHVMVLHNFWPTVDELSILHYTSLVPVLPEIGVGPTYYDRWDGKGVWDGANLVLEADTYTEETTLSGRNVRIISPNGTATIRTP